MPVDSSSLQSLLTEIQKDLPELYVIPETNYAHLTLAANEVPTTFILTKPLLAGNVQGVRLDASAVYG